MTVGRFVVRILSIAALFGGLTAGQAAAAPSQPTPGSTQPLPRCSGVLAGDFDGDGLSNYEECELGTDQYREDSDLDGLTDPFEVDYGTDPTSSNTDGDTLRDGCEFSFLSNQGIPIDPRIYDTDTDGEGIADLLESHFGLDPYSRDTDQDILTDYEEWTPCAGKGSGSIAAALDPDQDDDDIPDGIERKSTHTNPYNADTDEDGYSDYYEVYVYNTDPLDSEDHPDPNGYPPDHP